VHQQLNKPPLSFKVGLIQPPPDFSAKLFVTRQLKIRYRRFQFKTSIRPQYADSPGPSCVGYAVNERPERFHS
jgi:hypothetical protein